LWIKFVIRGVNWTNGPYILLSLLKGVLDERIKKILKPQKPLSSELELEPRTQGRFNPIKYFN